ncbi:MAG TPA: Xaa-Pro peptidase family protein, partial [Nitrososphaerales archaeon]|nr:Xaa-Pro peptidase family protein [Nitrososphaerales archaeon]
MAQGTWKRRADSLRRKIADQGLDGVIIAPGPNLRYYTGVNSQMFERPFLFFQPSDGEAQLVAPRLEAGPYKRAQIKMDIHDWDDASGPSGAFGALRRKIDLKGRWGCEGRVPFGFLTHITRDDLELAPAEPVLQAIREVKEPSELQSLRKAATILSGAYGRVPEFLREGITELELSSALREEIFARGGETVDFCMVQAGAHAADSHWASSSKKIAKGEGIIIDAGCTFEGYNADITRTFLLGSNAELERVYADVLEAQKRAVEKAAEGVEVGSIDAAARSHLKSRRLGKYFFHRTGHGLGLEIHEAPYIVPGGDEKLK